MPRKDRYMDKGPKVTQLIDRQELAELWRVSPHTIRLWVKQKRLRPLGLCRRLLFLPSECERFLKHEQIK